MSDARLRARSTSEIVDAAFSLYRQQPLVYMLAAAAGNVPYLVGALLMQNGSASANLATSDIGVALMLASVVIYGLMSAAVIHVGSRAYLGETPDLGESIRAILPRTLTILGASIERTIWYSIGFFMLVIPFFWVFARYFAVIPIITLEGSKMSKAFKRSAQLSDGRKGHILGTLLLVWVIYFVAAIGLSAMMGLVLGGSQVITTLLSTIVTVVIYPVIALTEMVLYYDARIRSEGFDLERMAQELGIGGAPDGSSRAG